MEKFKELGLNENLLKVLEELHFKEPTEIQAKAIPLAMQGKDIIGGSATGSGKTLAFGATILQHVKKNEGIQAIILTPTRELAEQVSSSLKRFGRYTECNILAVYGGVDMERQMRELATTNIVVGTPGRVLDHLSRRTLNLSEIKWLVLDEVDRMFDMGFQEDVENIIKECPKNRQTMLFSATISADIDYLAKKHTRDAVEVSVESYVDASQLTQIYYDVPSKLKFSLLVQLLKAEKSDLVMIFSNTKRNADFIGRNLKLHGIDAHIVHGGLTQNRRNANLEAFHEGKVNVLVCTDVAARGLDIKGVSHVYNYDVPKTSADYIHRIGRTARAGAEGKAITLLSDRDYDNFRNVRRDESLDIKPEELPYVQSIEVQTDYGRKDDRRGYSRGSSYGRRSDYSRPRRENSESREYNPERGGYGRANRDSRRAGEERPVSRGASRTYSRERNSFGRRDSRDERPRTNGRGPTSHRHERFGRR
jgi:ATP-dependent RNA helicase DeaD